MHEKTLIYHLPCCPFSSVLLLPSPLSEMQPPGGQDFALPSHEHVAHEQRATLVPGDLLRPATQGWCRHEQCVFFVTSAPLVDSHFVRRLSAFVFCCLIVSSPSLALWNAMSPTDAQMLKRRAMTRRLFAMGPYANNTQRWTQK
jgi:hypothetical protein